MKLIVDAMGGDHAPDQIVLGAMEAKEDLEDLELVFTGDEKAIREVMKKNGLDPDSVRIVDAPDTISMEEDPLCILKSKRNSSMAKGLCLLRDGQGDAFLSAGSTGALVVGSSSRIYKVKIPGVRRVAIGSVLPLTNPTLLMDSGANLELSPEEMVQFAHMGNAYMKGVYGLKKPKIALVNNGAEETKGTALYAESHRLLKKEESLRFVGNIEGRDIPLGKADVILCDGFVGNVILKLSEGFGKFISKELKGMLGHGLKGKLAGLLILSDLKKFKSRLSYEKHGGAPILGTVRPVIKAHGSSKKKAIENAVKQAERCHKSGLCRVIAEAVARGEGEA